MERILIVDDSRTARMFARRFLTSMGFEAEFVEAENGQEGLEKLRQSDINFALVDLNMPIMGGRAMLRRAKVSPRLREIPIVIISSLVSPALETELLEMGASAILRKPISPVRMAAVFQEMRTGGVL